MRSVRRGLMRVDFSDGTHKLIAADKKIINPDGSLTLYQFETVSGYAVPTRLKEVETYAPGVWSKVKADFTPKPSTKEPPCEF